ncbi:hypothetical protein [Arthrobacter sp. NPDC089319]|uniref:hypothetical protein n=1 Tax=Arthrobacter sp. NPDC089319 TaxID=3155915 RepID=UPI00342F82E3
MTVTVVPMVASMVAVTVVAPIMMVIGRHALNRAGRRRSGGHCQASEAECSNKQRGPDNAQLCVVHGVSLFQFYLYSEWDFSLQFRTRKTLLVL